MSNGMGGGEKLDETDVAGEDHGIHLVLIQHHYKENYAF